MPDGRVQDAHWPTSRTVGDRQQLVSDNICQLAGRVGYAARLTLRYLTISLGNFGYGECVIHSVSLTPFGQPAQRGTKRQHSSSTKAVDSVLAVSPARRSSRPPREAVGARLLASQEWRVFLEMKGELDAESIYQGI